MKRTTWAAALLISAALTMLAGCGGDSSGPAPVTSVSLEPGQANIEVGHYLQITPTVAGDNKSLTWYVNGVENGNEIVGAISQNSPVKYTAPNWLPDPATVVVKAVSVEDTSLYDSCVITITFNKLFVDAVGGNDDDNGCINLPFKTITHAMAEADSGTTVVVQPGTYDHANGEVFPINMGVGQDVELVGMDWETCIIRGHSDMGSGVCVAVSGQGCRFRKFTIDPGPPVDPACNIAVSMGGTGCLVDSLRTAHRANYSFLRLQYSTDCTIENNYFVVTDGEHVDRGYEIVFGNTGTVIRNCTVSGYWAGFFFNLDEDALVEGCVLEDNNYGIELCCFESETSNPAPDFGGGARGSAGGNFIRNNVGCGLLNSTYNVIYAKYNTWNNSPPVAGEDYCNESTGGVVVE
jgi:hypothetical protein